MEISSKLFWLWWKLFVLLLKHGEKSEKIRKRDKKNPNTSKWEKMLTEKKLNEETLWKQKNVTKRLKKCDKKFEKNGNGFGQGARLTCEACKRRCLRRGWLSASVSEAPSRCWSPARCPVRRDVAWAESTGVHCQKKAQGRLLSPCYVTDMWHQKFEIFLWRATEFKCLHWQCIPQIHGGAQMGEIWLLLGLHGGLRVGQLDVTFVPVLILFQTRILMTPTKKNDLTDINNEEKQQKGSCQWSYISFNVHFIHHSTADLHMPIDQPVHLQKPCEFTCEHKRELQRFIPIFCRMCTFSEIFDKSKNQPINQSINRPMIKTNRIFKAPRNRHRPLPKD